MRVKSIRKLQQREVLIGGVLVVCSLAAYKLATEDGAPYMLLPGSDGCTVVAANGNAHGAKEGVIWSVALLFNLLCYGAAQRLDKRDR